MATVHNPDGSIKRKVKNLGWLLRHWQEVESLHFVHYTREASARKMQPDGLFVADLCSGGYFATDFASYDVWKLWINRPVFRGLDCEVRGIHGAV